MKGEKDMSRTPKEVIEFARERGAEIVDLKFTDIPGTWQHFSIPMSQLKEAIFEEGVGFDGSSIRGFQEIQESDMILLPDPNTAIMDPILEVPTLSMICNVLDPPTHQHYTRDPRYVAQKAERFLVSTGMADVSCWGPEAEFYVFDDVRFDQRPNCGYYFVDSVEGIWNSGKEEKPNLGHKPRFKEGYFPVPPTDSMQDMRSRMVLKLQEAGVKVEVQHHEVGTAGQAEIDMCYDTLVRMGDNVMIYKYIVKNVARQHGKTATFMPKPIFEENGSGMHTHQSLWKNEQNLFWDEMGYAQISQMAKYYIGGLLKHSSPLLAFCAPTTNAYRRLVPGYEAPVNLVFSQRNRSACVRIPVYTRNPAHKRVEYRPPDPSCNPYLAFAAMLMAGIDGVINKLDPGEPIDKDLYDLPPEEAAMVRSTPGSLEEVLHALEEDHEFLRRGDVFTEDLIEKWIGYKRKREVDPIRIRPHPYEFFLYYDV
jgi:glutamine synthetase